MRGIWKQRNVDEKAWRGGVSFSPLLPCPSCPARQPTDGQALNILLLLPTELVGRRTTYSRAKREREGGRPCNHPPSVGVWAKKRAMRAVLWYGMAWHGNRGVTGEQKQSHSAHTAYGGVIIITLAVIPPPLSFPIPGRCLASVR